MKKKLSLLLGVILLMVGTAYGTWATFKDEKENDVGINLKLGNLQIKSESSYWFYNGTQKEDKDTKFLNVSPGDEFTKEYKVTNIGSLPAHVMLKEDTETEKPKGSAYDITIESTESNSISSGILLQPDGSATFNLKISVPENLENDYNQAEGVNNPDMIALDYMKKTIIFEAELK